MRYDFITIGGSTEDITFYTKEGFIVNNENIPNQKLWAFSYGSKVRISDTHCSFGGGAANAAVNLAGLGFKVACLTALGNDDRSRKILKNFKKNKVITKLVQIKKGETGFSFLLIGKDKEHIIFSDRGANHKLKILNVKKIQKTDMIYLASLSGEWTEVLKQVFSVDSVNIAWNPGGVQIDAGVNKIGKFLRKTKILFVNQEEAINLILTDKKYKNKPKSFLANIKGLLVALYKMGPEIVVITRGKRGANAYNGKEFFYQKGVHSKKVMDTTGVGDAFNSSVCAGLKMFNGDISKAMQLGANNASSVTSKNGAQNGLLKKNEIVKLI